MIRIVTRRPQDINRAQGLGRFVQALRAELLKGVLVVDSQRTRGGFDCLIDGPAHTTVG